MAHNLVLLGPPGVGKGTQAASLTQSVGVPHISTGDMLRAAVANRTDLGLQAQQHMDEGTLVPDALVIGIVRERIVEPDCRTGFLLDGFPRTIAQAEALEGAIENLSLEPLVVIDMAAPDDVLVRRLSGRRMCDKCGAIFHTSRDNVDVGDACPEQQCDGKVYQRSDDHPEAIRERLDVYKAQTQPLIDYYANRGQLCQVDATGTVADVNERVSMALQDRGIA